MTMPQLFLNRPGIRTNFARRREHIILRRSQNERPKLNIVGIRYTDHHVVGAVMVSIAGHRRRPLLR